MRHRSSIWRRVDMRIALMVPWLLLFWAIPVQAHRVIIFAWIEGDTIHTESKFSNGRPVQGGAIEVYDDKGIKLLEGITDDQGRFAFPVPVQGDLKVVIAAGMGHTAHWMVRAEEIDPSPGREAIPSTPAPDSAEKDSSAALPRQDAVDHCVDADTVEQIVRKVLDTRLGVLETRLAAQHSQWRDVLAGLGYILGLVGLVAYMRNRKIR